MSTLIQRSSDWLLRRRRCPFCVAPFPVLRVVDFEEWQCSECDSRFTLDDEGELESVYDQSRHASQDDASTFFNSLFDPVANQKRSESDILCTQCTHHQSVIVQYMQNFEIDGKSRVDARIQYENAQRHLEAKYPLCATCTYRVNMHLAECQQRALNYQRHHNALASQPASKLDLVKKIQTGRKLKKLSKLFMCLPDFLLQLYILYSVIFSWQDLAATPFPLKQMLNYSIELDSHLHLFLYAWLPPSMTSSLNFPSLYFLMIGGCFFMQFLGIGFNGRGMGPLAFQLFIAFTRAILGNSLFLRAILQDSEDGADSVAVFLMGQNTCLAVAAIISVVVLRIGARNFSRPLKGRNVPIEAIFKKRDGLSISEVPRTAQPINVPYEEILSRDVNNALSLGSTNENSQNNLNLNRLHNRMNNSRTSSVNSNSLPNTPGFGKYSEPQYRYHSFANQVSGDQSAKPIKPYPTAPQPGRLSMTNQSNMMGSMSSLLSSRGNQKDGYNGVGLRPTMLDSCEPVGLEPFFNSISLSDSPRESKKNNLRSNSTILASPHDQFNTKQQQQQPRAFTNSRQRNLPTILNYLTFAYQSSLTIGLLLARYLLHHQITLLTLILAASFSLRGFLWNRLNVKVQVVLLIITVVRLAWLAGEVSHQISFNYYLMPLAGIVDSVLIALR